MPLDHLVHEIRWSNGTQVVQPHASGPSRPAASRHARRRPTMRDAQSGRSGGGAPEPPRRRPDRPRRPHRPIPPRRAPPTCQRRFGQVITDDPRAPPPSTTPLITPGKRRRRSRTRINPSDPPHRTRETHSGALGIIFRSDVGPSATPFSLCYASCPFIVREKGAQQRVGERSRGKEAQQRAKERSRHRPARERRRKPDSLRSCSRKTLRTTRQPP